MIGKVPLLAGSILASHANLTAHGQGRVITRAQPTERQEKQEKQRDGPAPTWLTKPKLRLSTDQKTLVADWGAVVIEATVELAVDKQAVRERAMVRQSLAWRAEATARWLDCPVAKREFVGQVISRTARTREEAWREVWKGLAEYFRVPSQWAGWTSQARREVTPRVGAWVRGRMAV